MTYNLDNCQKPDFVLNILGENKVKPPHFKLVCNIHTLREPILAALLL